jgi:hypothetical protein
LFFFGNDGSYADDGVFDTLIFAATEGMWAETTAGWFQQAVNMAIQREKLNSPSFSVFFVRSMSL